MSTNPFRVGDEVHGFADGYFGRDSYGCRRVEAVGPDWIVTRRLDGAGDETQPAVEFVGGAEQLAGLAVANTSRVQCEHNEPMEPDDQPTWGGIVESASNCAYCAAAPGAGPCALHRKDDQSRPFSIADTCCGACPGGACYVDGVTGA